MSELNTFSENLQKKNPSMEIRGLFLMTQIFRIVYFHAKIA